jgi:hypothetical protein
MMMKLAFSVVFFSLCLASAGDLHAQSRYKLYEEDKPVLMKNELSGGITLHSSGWGITGRRGYSLTGYKKLVYEVELVGMKHPKEIRTANPYFENSRSYIYGKKNGLTILRPSAGLQHVLYSKGDRGGIEVRLNYRGGLSLGITKPVYLDILYPTNVPYEFEVLTERYNPEKHFIDNIYGKSSFTNGLDELNIHPGLYGKLGFSFEYSTDFEKVALIETGIALDAYPKAIELMALTENKPIFMTFYFSVLLGKKW